MKPTSVTPRALASVPCARAAEIWKDIVEFHPEYIPPWQIPLRAAATMGIIIGPLGVIIWLVAFAILKARGTSSSTAAGWAGLALGTLIFVAAMFVIPRVLVARHMAKRHGAPGYPFDGVFDQHRSLHQPEIRSVVPTGEGEPREGSGESGARD